MKKITEDLLAELTLELQQIALEADNKLQLAERSFHAARKKLELLNARLSIHSFRDEAEEIAYFKYQKPELLKEVFYYEELFNLESKKPIGTSEDINRYYKKYLKRIGDFFDDNRFLYNYYLSGETEFDQLYFSKLINPISISMLFYMEADNSIARPFSTRLAKLNAYQLLRTYLDAEMTSNAKTIGFTDQNDNPQFIGKDVSFVELCAGLYYGGSVRQRKGGFEGFVNKTATFFGVKIVNVHRIIYSMGIRKKEMTPYLYFLSNALKAWFEQRNE